MVEEDNVNLEVCKNLIDREELKNKVQNETTKEKTNKNNDFNELCSEKSDTDCGVGCFPSKSMQKYASIKVYIIVYSIMTCMVTASAAYFSGTITTIEKRFKVPSKTTALIAIGNHVANLLASGGLSYYTSKGHRPRWIAVGTYTVMLYCFLAMFSHFLYGPGESALQLTREYLKNSPNEFINNNSLVPTTKERSFLCLPATDNSTINQCEEMHGNYPAQILLFFARFLFGIGDSIISTLGMSYIDDSIPKARAPAIFSIIYFVKMIGPAAGYALSSFTLSLYIAPSLHPIINSTDPRWLGAWWLGWIILAVIFFLFGSIIGQFPKVLSRKSSVIPIENEQNSTTKKNSIEIDENEIKDKASWSDLKKTLKQLVFNGTLMCNTLSSVFFMFGFLPFWIYMPKYIETQYKKSASESALITGIGAVFSSAFGFLLSGAFISKYKPKGRYLATWNIFSTIIAVCGIVSYTYMGCAENENQLMNLHGVDELHSQINFRNNCNCDYVPYDPVCTEDRQTFISACHAGCKNITIKADGTKQYTDCTDKKSIKNQTAVPGPCPVDCQNKLYIFLAIVFLLNFTASAGGSTRFLIPLRCVEKKNKPVAMGFSMTILSLCALIPAPIVYGILFDKSCLVWGKTCTGTGNCWMYDAAAMRHLINFTSAGFMCVCIVFDVGVWYFIKNVKMFDDK